MHVDKDSPGDVLPVDATKQWLELPYPPTTGLSVCVPCPVSDGIDGIAKARTGRRRSAELHAMEEQLKDLQVNSRGQLALTQEPPIKR